MRKLIILLVALTLPQMCTAWDGLAVGTGPESSSSYQLVHEYDLLFRARAPEFGVGLVPQSQADFSTAKAELLANRLDLAILPLSMVDGIQIQVLAVLWDVVILPFRLHPGGTAMDLGPNPIFVSTSSNVFQSPGLSGLTRLGKEPWSAQLSTGDEGDYLYEILGNPRVVKGLIGREIYPQDLGPNLSQMLQSKVSWLEPTQYSYKLQHSSLGYTLVLAARADLNLEAGNQLYRLLLNPPRQSWGTQYLVQQLAVGKTTLLPEKLRHKAISYVKTGQK